MTEKIEAVLRCATNIDSFVPSRIVKTNLIDFGREGYIKVWFTYDSKDYEFVIPYKRPYKNKAANQFANLLNLNQRRGENNEEFQELVRRITHDFQVYPGIEIPCQIENQTVTE